jgi:hypothetical protein
MMQPERCKHHRDAIYIRKAEFGFVGLDLGRSKKEEGVKVFLEK